MGEPWDHGRWRGRHKKPKITDEDRMREDIATQTQRRRKGETDTKEKRRKGADAIQTATTGGMRPGEMTNERRTTNRYEGYHEKKHFVHQSI